jgi:hypothetical protein
MTVNTNWVAIPEILYLIVVVASVIFSVMSLSFIIFGITKRKSRKQIIAWLIVLVVCLLLLYLTMVAHVIIADTMHGG